MAKLVSVHGLWIEKKLIADNDTLSFLRSSEHTYHAFYRHKIAEYQNEPRDPARSLLVFTCSDEGFTRKEFAIIKLTAQFVVRYGYGFWLGLMNIVVTNPKFQFDFLKSTDLYNLFHRLVGAYLRVLMSCLELCKPGAPAPTEAVLEGFFNLLRGEKQEGAVSDFHAFVGALDYFANKDDQELSPPPGEHSIRCYPPVPPPPMLGMSPPRPALVPEDQFLAHHPGPSTIRIRVDDDDGQVIEITVQSLSESVASLKEKIANKLKLSGKDRFLEDNTSLAHYNVGPGEIITLSL